MSKIYISKLANNILQEYLQNNGHIIKQINSKASVDPAIAFHPDIYMCNLGEKIFHGDPGLLLPDYPGHAIYNGCSTGKFFIHNLKITSPDLMNTVDKLNQIKIHVAQGYTKCNCVVIDENSIITADKGIEKSAKKAGMDVLLIQPAQVNLKGYRYGFLGGASGKVGNSIIFNGNITNHSDYNIIKNFIKKRDLDLVYFNQYPLTDIGSIIEDPKS
ncbi:MAG: hypothetical protein HFE74_03925 [Firmicutes bacterium]|jgi:hypothetical protein|nr:hypothetical protein [Bacillota bacterium]